MVRAFVFNSPYPAAPFSTLYLFGRGQDIGFQKAIDDSPRKRHHIRFWALSTTRAEETLGTASFWLNTDRPPETARVYWVGAGTRDTGFSLTRLTFQVTHATASDTNVERDFIVAELSRIRVIADATSYKAGQPLSTARVNHYVTDGEVTMATLIDGGAGGSGLSDARRRAAEALARSGGGRDTVASREERAPPCPPRSRGGKALTRRTS